MGRMGFKMLVSRRLKALRITILSGFIWLTISQLSNRFLSLRERDSMVVWEVTQVMADISISALPVVQCMPTASH